MLCRRVDCQARVSTADIYFEIVTHTYGENLGDGSFAKHSTCSFSIPALKRLLVAACPSHALIVDTEGGPPSVVAHLPCAEGRYCSRKSRVLLMSIAQERLVDALQQRLDKEREATARLSRQLGRVQSRAAAVSPEGKD